MQSNRRSTMLLSLATAAMALVLGLSGCGGSSSGMGYVASSASSTSSSGSSSTTGQALISLTDAPGAFLTYLVKVDSINLTRSDGAVTTVVPNVTQVDFAQLVNLAEIISAQQVPSGQYTSVSMTLDYANATLVVDNGGSGITVPAANIINGSTSNALVSPNSQVTVTLQLPQNAPLVVNHGTVSHLALDFNLATSNTVAPSTITTTTAASAVTVTVNPTLAASLTPDTTRPLEVRGTLASVASSGTASTYTVNVSPFFDDAAVTQGQLVVTTTPTTTFAINGSSYTGAAGLTALAAVASGTIVIASGTYDSTTGVYTATSVLAGTSLVSGNTAGVVGTVLARSGNVLTVAHGLTCGGNSGAGANVSASGSVAVTVAASTTVIEDGQSGSFDISNISVGQHVQISGTLGTDSSGHTTLDASAGTARLMPTQLLGTFLSQSGKITTVTLTSIDGVAASSLNFAGTGSSSANDAVASAYTVSFAGSTTTSPVGNTITSGTILRFTGFVSPYGSAPPDFVASSSTTATSGEWGGNGDGANSMLLVLWPATGIDSPLVPVPTNASAFELSQAGLQLAPTHIIRTNGVSYDPSVLTPGLLLQGNPSALRSQFLIGHALTRVVDSYSSMADFVTALTTDLNGVTPLSGIQADGTYSPTSGIFQVDAIEAVVLN